MAMTKIKKVVIGNDMKSTVAEIKSEPVISTMQSYQHDSLQCFQCFITFSDYKAKERHMRKSHREQYKQQLQQANTVFTCYTCDRSFDSSEDLSLHQATHNTQEKSFCCPYCQASFFTFSELTRHRRHECAERQCPCKDCGALFPSPSRLRNHRIAMHLQHANMSDEDNTYQCCKCSYGFKTEKELLHHQEKFANDMSCDVKPPVRKRGRRPKSALQDGMVNSKMIKQEDKTCDSGIEGCILNEAQSELQIPCSEAECDLIFPSVTALRAHKKDKHGPPPCTQKTHKKNKHDESNALPEQLKDLTAGAQCSAYTCPSCGVTFGQESELNDHQKIHEEAGQGAEQR